MKRATLEGIIRRYADARVALSWRGGGDPEDFDAVGVRAKAARRKLAEALDEVFAPRVDTGDL